MNEFNYKNLSPLNEITIKYDKVRKTKIYSHLLNRQFDLIAEEKIPYKILSKTIRTNIKLVNSLFRFCGLSTSTYDYVKSLKYPLLW